VRNQKKKTNDTGAVRDFTRRRLNYRQKGPGARHPEFNIRVRSGGEGTE